VKTIKYECLRHFVFFGERHLRYVVKEFMAHYHRERFHQSLDGHPIEKPDDGTRRSGKVACRPRLGGMLNFYYREAA
jgi:putative transposase